MYLMRNHDVWIMCAAPTAIRALPLTGYMTLSTKPPDTVFLCAAHLLTIAAETP